MIANAVATLSLVGLIWFVQVVHYPLLGLLDAAGAAEHQRLTGYVVAVPMVVEAATALALVPIRPDGVTALSAWIGLALVAVVWLSTALLQMPRHRALAFDLPATERGRETGRLVAGNWIRTAAWTARGGVVVWMLAAAA